MLTTKKRAHIFLIFFVGFSILAGWTGCAPSGARALIKGDKLLNEGKYSEAVQKYEEAVKAYPKNAKAWNHLGLGYQYAGDPKKAAQAYQQALSLDRNLTAAGYNFGVLQLEQGNYSEAISRLTTFTQLEPKNPQGWLKLGTAQLEYAARASGSDKTRQLDAAKRSLDYSQKLQPSAETLNAIGLVQIQRNRPRDAVSSFTTALQQQPNYAPSLLNLAIVYQEYFRDSKLALVNYRQFLAVAGNAPEVPQVRATVQQLEHELNPPPPPQAAVAAPVATPAPAPKPTPAPQPVVAAKPQIPSNTIAPAKVEPVAPKPAPAPVVKPPPAIVSAPVVNSPRTPAPAPAPTPQPQPAPVRKETPVEIATVPEEPVIKPAQEISTQQTAIQTRQVAPVQAPRPQSTVPATQGKNPGVLTKINPATWFKHKPKATTPVTDLPASKSSIEPGSEIAASELSTKSNASELRAAIPRYKYQFPSRPAAGNRAEAKPIFTRAIEAQKDRRFADALELYRQAIRLDPSFFEAYYNMALTTRDAGDLSAALPAYEQALAIMPESVNARYNFAFTLQEAGYFLDSANELKKVLSQNPNETRAHFLLGNLNAQRLNDIPAAREHYLKVLENEPNHPQATAIRYWLANHP